MKAEFPAQTLVRVRSREILEHFLRPEFKYHHPLVPAQREFAGRIAKVISVAYYHGGDELYKLEGIPGIWHEGCLEPPLPGRTVEPGLEGKPRADAT